MQKLKVLGIVKSSEGKTLGGKFRNLETDETLDITTDSIIRHKHEIICTNAIIDKNGFLKSKFGYKLNIFHMIDSTNYRINDDIEKHIYRINMENKETTKKCHDARLLCMQMARDINNSAEVL